LSIVEAWPASAFATLLRDQVAVVTGAAQGNGAAIARGLATSGASVAVADVNFKGAQEVAAAIDAAGGRAEAFALDVGDRAACTALAEAIERRLGAAAILINNAGIIRRTPLDAPNFLADMSEQLRVNVEGIFNVTLAFLDQLRRTRGRIVNIASIASFIAYRNVAGYVASKGAVKQLTKALAADLALDGIRVNAIAPGVIATPMTERTRATPEIIDRFMAHTPMNRV
jgi:NAD(P)-dependent dehydrogenase (short-subunit alcohol dehydrogenase family)